MRRQLALGLIETDGGIRFVDIDKKTIAYHDRNRNKISMKYVAGMKRMAAKSLPDKAFSEASIPEERLWMFPNGKVDGRIHQNSIQFVFGLCHLVKDAKITELAVELVLAEKQRKRAEHLETEKKELEEEVKKLQRMNALLK